MPQLPSRYRCMWGSPAQGWATQGAPASRPGAFAHALRPAPGLCRRRPERAFSHHLLISPLSSLHCPFALRSFPHSLFRRLGQRLSFEHTPLDSRHRHPRQHRTRSSAWNRGHVLPRAAQNRQTMQTDRLARCALCRRVLDAWRAAALAQSQQRHLAAGVGVGRVCLRAPCLLIPRFGCSSLTLCQMGQQRSTTYKPATAHGLWPLSDRIASHQLCQLCPH